MKLTRKSYTPPPEFKNEAWSSNSRCHSLEAYRGDRSRWLQEVELDVSLITMPWAFKTRTWKVISCSSSSAPQLLKLWSCSQIQKSANWEKSYFLMGLEWRDKTCWLFWNRISTSGKLCTVLHTFGVLYTALMFQEKNFTQNFIAMRLSSASMVVVRWKYLLLTRLRVGMDLIHTQLASYLDAQRGHDQVVPLLPWLGLVLLEMLALPWFECLVGMYWQKIFCPYIQ